MGLCWKREDWVSFSHSIFFTASLLSIPNLKKKIKKKLLVQHLLEVMILTAFFGYGWLSRANHSWLNLCWKLSPVQVMVLRMLHPLACQGSFRWTGASRFSVTNYLPAICEITWGEGFSTAHLCETRRGRCAEGYSSGRVAGCCFCRYKIDRDAVSWCM